MKVITLLFLFVIAAQASDNDNIAFLQWSQSHREMYQLNKKFVKRLEKKIEAKQIIGLELIIAEKSDIRVESRFGHAMFRFVDSDSDPGNDITVSFVADVDGPDMSTVGGITGKYTIFPVFKSMRLYIKQYIKDDGRPLERHIIPSDNSMREDLLATLQNWWKDIVDGEQRVYEEALKVAKEEAIKKGQELYKENGFEIFEMKFKDDLQERVYSFGIVEKESNPFQNDTQRNEALYRQAYKIAYKKLSKNLAENEIILNLGQELWSVENGENIYYMTSNDFEYAQELAQAFFKDQKFKLFTRFNAYMEPNGYYALKMEDELSPYENLSVKNKEKVELVIKNLEVKGILSENMGKYTFFSNNCAGAVIKLLKDANFPHKKRVGIQGRVPVKLDKWMARSLLNPYPAFRIDKAEKLKVKLSKLLGLNRKEFENYSFPIYQWPSLERNLTKEETFLFYNIYDSTLEQEYLSVVRQSLLGRSAPNYNIIHGLETAKSVIYELCTTKQCAKSITNLLKSNWTSKEIKKAKKQINRTGNNTFIYEGLLKRESVLNHLKLIKYIDKDFGL
ncbi:DUF4105 domain-containing protein [Halobacteriovorax sp. HLS]|uniref:lipoprotein N-acyltransferase Lnb domain-containing protein n=1 Tax=Halobacteriovorax sp. HLS TaxID=2234000 RepID=UPI000FDB3A51|nr:DUF4105 domain-containing protein [Halobacteriovorax sp. HLS]